VTLGYVEKRKERSTTSEILEFHSLKEDQANGLYSIRTEFSNKLRQPAAEKQFPGYCKRTVRNEISAEDAVTEMIKSLSLDEDSGTKICRHDFQPSIPGTHNLQIQLGGVKDFRRGQNDSSETCVVIDKELWNKMYLQNKARLKQVVQAAHRFSFDNNAKVFINPTGEK